MWNESPEMVVLCHEILSYVVADTEHIDRVLREIRTQIRREEYEYYPERENQPESVAGESIRFYVGFEAIDMTVDQDVFMADLEAALKKLPVRKVVYHLMSSFLGAVRGMCIDLYPRKEGEEDPFVFCQYEPVY